MTAKRAIWFFCWYGAYMFGKTVVSPALGVPTAWSIPVELVVIVFYWIMTVGFVPKETK